MKVLMVCLGNICRSPLAEGILQHKANAAGLNWQVESAGTSNYHPGDAPHVLSQKVALLNGIDISAQRARQFNKTDFTIYDRIYAMDMDNYEDIKIMSGNLWNESKVDLLLNELYANEDRGVPDPWYGKEDGYHKVFAMISDACDVIIERELQQSSKLK